MAEAADAGACQGFFIEPHPDPANTISDGPNMIALNDLPALLDACLAVWRAVR